MSFVFVDGLVDPMTRGARSEETNPSHHATVQTNYQRRFLYNTLFTCTIPIHVKITRSVFIVDHDWYLLRTLTSCFHDASFMRTVEKTDFDKVVRTAKTVD